MSEIKGTLLSIVLAIAMFGVVLTLMTTTFTNVSNTIGENAEAAVETSH
jgi:hypothetical protein